MRVAFTVPAFAPARTGPALAVEEIARRLADRGQAVTVATLTPAPVGFDDAFRFDVVRLPDPGPAFPPSGLAAHLDGWRPDVVVAHELRNGLTLGALRWALRAGVRVAVQPHGGVAGWRQLPGRWRRWPYAAHDALLGRWRRDPRVTLIASCRREAEEIGVRNGSPRVVRLYLGTDLHVHPRVRGAHDPPRALMLANFGRVRDPRWAVDAVRRVRELGHSVELRLAGPRQAQTRFGGHVPLAAFEGAHWLGPVSESDRPRVFADADLFLYPTRYESFGLPILEAAASGLPVVAPRVGIAAELGLDEGAGALAPGPELPGFAAALADVLRRLDDAQAEARLRSPALRGWAQWERRVAPYRTWLEGGEVELDPPPGPLGRPAHGPEP